MLPPDVQDQVVERAAHHVRRLLDEEIPLEAPFHASEPLQFSAAERDPLGPAAYPRPDGTTSDDDVDVEKAFANYMVGQGLAKPGDVLPPPGSSAPTSLLPHGADGPEPVADPDGLAKLFAGREGAIELDRLGAAWEAWSGSV